MSDIMPELKVIIKSSGDTIYTYMPVDGQGMTPITSETGSGTGG